MPGDFISADILSIRDSKTGSCFGSLLPDYPRSRSSARQIETVFLHRSIPGTFAAQS
jgi:hypothetical protein